MIISRSTLTSRRSRVRLLVGLAAAATLAGGLAVAPAQAAKGGNVRGVVTIEGQPVAGATVKLLRAEADSIDTYSTYRTTTTDDAGAYSFPDYHRSGYVTNRVIVTDRQARLVATERSFTDSATRTTTRNVTTQRAGAIRGTVTRANGSAPTATRVTITGPGESFNRGGNEELVYDDDNGVRADGSYSFKGLPPGQYNLRFDDTDGTYLSECLGGGLAEPGASPFCLTTTPTVTVTAGSVATPATQQLDHPGARVLGLVTDTSGHPLKGIDVTPYVVGVTPPQTSASFSTRSSGRFTAAPLAAGAAQLQVRDGRGVWDTQWVGGDDRPTATVLALTEGATVRDQVVRLKSRATLRVKASPGTGRVTFTVAVTRKATGSRPSGRVTISAGAVTRTVSVVKGAATVTLTGLPAGRTTFRVAYDGTSSTADASTSVATSVR